MFTLSTYFEDIYFLIRVLKLCSHICKFMGVLLSRCLFRHSILLHETEKSSKNLEASVVFLSDILKNVKLNTLSWKTSCRTV